MNRLLILSALLIGMTQTARAEDATSGLSGEVSLSGSKTTGNTDTTNAGLAAQMTYVSGPWKTAFNTAYDYGQVSGQDTNNRWTIGLQVNRQIHDGFYAYVNGNYFTDDFGPFKNGTFLGGGFGLNLIKNDRASWSLEGGTGYRSQRSRGTVLVLPQTQTNLAAQGKSQFTYQFNEAVNFSNSSEIIWSDTDTYLQNDAGITAQLFGQLAARFSVHVDYHSDVPDGVEHTDTITRVGLVYTLK